MACNILRKQFPLNCTAISLLILVTACKSIDAPRTDPTGLTFSGSMGSPDPAPQTFRIESSQFWRAKTTTNWILVSPDSGVGPTTVQVSIRPLLLVGDVTDTVHVTLAGGTFELPVHLHRTGKSAQGLLYLSDSVFVAGPDGSGARVLHLAFDPPARNVFPRSLVYSSNGDRIAFFASPAGFDGVWFATPEGTITGGGVFGACRYPSPHLGWSPLGDTLAWVCSGSGPGSDFLNITGRPAQKIAGAGSPAWSPDGTWILAGGLLISADRTRPDTAMEVTYPLGGIGWTPDGRILIAGACAFGVFTIGRGASLVRGAPLTPLLGPGYNYATFSPDGTKLLAVRCSPSPAVELMNSDGTNVTWTVPGANWAAWRP